MQIRANPRPKPKISIQYLQDSPDLADRSIKDVRERLRIAGDKLPLSEVLIGWQVPPSMLKACRQEAERLDATLYRWHPLLASDGVFYPRPEWRVIGLHGEPLAGFQDMPDFTFVCPNRPQVRAAVMERLENLIADGAYEGLFLDRMRFPSPAADPLGDLGCFCPSCHQAAARQGLDLARIRATLQAWGQSAAGKRDLVRALLQPLEGAPDSPQAGALKSFLRFRCESVSGLVRLAAERLQAARMPVGLDCFSPALMTMVGQDNAALAACADWVKLMCYAHTLGPAGLPFELLSLADWLVERAGLDGPGALELLSQATGLPLPADRGALRVGGLSSGALRVEVGRGVAASSAPCLFGVELMEMEGVVSLDPVQIRGDLSAVREVGPGGLALSWDLWDMPLGRLDLVREVWLEGGGGSKGVGR